MTNRLLRTSLAAALAITVAGCSDDDNGLGPTIELTEEQTVEMTTVLGTLALEGDFGFEAQAANALAAFRQRDVALATVSVNETLSCPVSGSRHTTGSATMNDAQTEFTANFTQTYTSCKAAAESGVVWTFDSAPSMTLSLNATNNTDTGVITITMNLNGGFNVASDDGRSGSCVISLAWNMTADESAGTASASVNGTVCGRSVSQSIDVTA